jgi:hypothetical protein
MALLMPEIYSSDEKDSGVTIIIHVIPNSKQVPKKWGEERPATEQSKIGCTSAQCAKGSVCRREAGVE